MAFQDTYDKFQAALQEVADDPAAGEALVVLVNEIRDGAGTVADWECMHTPMSVNELGNLLVYAAGSAMRAETDEGKKWDAAAVGSYFDTLAELTVRFLKEDGIQPPLLS